MIANFQYIYNIVQNSKPFNINQSESFNTASKTNAKSIGLKEYLRESQ